jgi:hypothetical protein
MAKAKRQKRPQGHPVILPSRHPKPNAKRQAAARARWKPVLARTAAGRARQRELAEGADMRDLEHLAVIAYPSGIAPKPMGLRKKVSDLGGDDELDVPPQLRERPPMAPPVPFETMHDEPVRERKPAPPLLPITLIEPPPKPRKKRTYYCSACGAEGHAVTSPNCPQRQLPICKFCSEPGHTRRHCPKRKHRAVIPRAA